MIIIPLCPILDIFSCFSEKKIGKIGNIKKEDKSKCSLGMVSPFFWVKDFDYVGRVFRSLSEGGNVWSISSYSQYY